MIDYRSIVFKIYSVSEYRHSLGAKCPLCSTWNCSSNSGIKIRNNKKIRYHKCSNCGLRYKSFELISTCTD